MLLTEQAARLQGGDWAPFFAAAVRQAPTLLLWTPL